MPGDSAASYEEDVAVQWLEAECVNLATRL